MQTSPAHTLGAVIKILPPDCYENPTWKGLAYVARDLVIYAAVVAALLAFDHPLLLIPLWILAGLAISALFILGHDAAHGALFRSDRLNYALGQLVMLPALHVYEAWVLGHNRLHHGHTVRQQMDFVWHPLTRQEFEQLSSFQKLLHRIEWSPLGAGLYYMIEVYWKKMVWFTPPEKLARAIRRDQSIVLGYFVLQTAALLWAGWAAYGTAGGALWMWTKVFAIPWIVWNYSIGIVVYLHHIGETIEWHPRREWTKFKGQMQGTTIFRIPRWADFFYHGIMIHVPHHVDMRIPFYGLPRAAEAILEHYGDVVRERALSLSDYWRTARRCKLYDFDKGTWTSYEGAPAAGA